MHTAVAIYTQMLEAWNRRDAAAFAALFTDTALAVGFDGSEMDGRGEVERQLGAIFAQHPTPAYVARVRHVRELQPGTWLLHAAVGMVPAGGRTINPAVNALQTLLVLEQEGTARIALLQSTPAAYHGRPHLRAALTAEVTALYERGVVVE